MLKRARASPGMRLTVGLPMSIEVNSRFDGSNLCAALVERLVHQRAHQLDEAAHRIVGAVRIGDVALLAGDDQHAVLRAAAADLDGVAELVDVARLAQHAMVELFAARGRPFQELGGAVDRDAFLVAGDQERDRALRLAAVRGEMIERRRDLAGDRALHVDGAAAVQHAVGDVARERRDATSALASPGGTTSVWPANIRCGAPCRCGRRGSRRRRCRARRTSCGAR